jgi:polyphosphate kinase
VRELLELMWKDNRQAWDLSAEGSWTQRQPRDEEREIATHKVMIERYKTVSRE